MKGCVSKYYILIGFLLLSLYGYSSKTDQIDSLHVLLESDTLSVDRRIKIMTTLIYKYSYRGDEALKLLDGVDSICNAHDLHYLRGRNAFNRSIRSNRNKTFDSVYIQSIELIDSMSRLVVGDQKDLLVFYNRAYANYYLGTEDIEKSEVYIQNCIDIASANDFDSFLPGLYSELAMRQRLQMKYFSAIENYNKALDYDYNKTCYVYSNLAKIYRSMEDYPNQLIYARKGKQAALDESIINVGITCALDEARAYYRMGKLDTSETYFLNALPSIKASRVSNRDQIVFEYLARIYYDQKNWEKLEELKGGLDKYQDDIYHSVYYALLGQSYLDRGMINKAQKYCERGFAAGHPIKYAYYTKEACNCLVDVYEIKGNYKKAFEMADAGRSIDSLTNNKERFLNISRALNIRDLKKQESFLTLQQEQKDQSNAMKLYRLRVMSAFILFLSLFGVFAYYQLKKRNERIAKQNKVIIESLKEKDVLLKEVHHRVKNNLQIISSLFSMQMREVEDDKTREILSDGKNRVHSIALVHQSLYQNDNLSQLSFEEYLTTLISDLYKTYEINANDIELTLEVGEFKFDIETMISIGLILNELLSNCLKHAFQPSQKGKIHLRLTEQNDQLILTVKDNGVSIDQRKITDSGILASKLIQAFSKKLKADITIENDHGTLVTMIINNYQKTS